MLLQIECISSCKSKNICIKGKLIKSVPCFPHDGRRSQSEGPKPGRDDSQKKNDSDLTYRLFKSWQLYGDARSYTYSQPGLSEALSPTPAFGTTSDTMELVAEAKQQVGDSMWRGIASL